MAGRIAAGRGLAITYKMQVQQPTKTFCNFMQKRLAKNSFLSYRRNKNCKDRYKKESIEHITKSSMLFLCKFTDYVLMVDKAEVVLYNRSKKNDKGDRDAFLG